MISEYSVQLFRPRTKEIIFTQISPIGWRILPRAVLQIRAHELRTIEQMWHWQAEVAQIEMNLLTRTMKVAKIEENSQYRFLSQAISNCVAQSKLAAECATEIERYVAKKALEERRHDNPSTD